MKPILFKTYYYTAIFVLFSCFFSSCVSSKGVDLDPPDKRPVFSVEVDDAAEAGLLQQEMKLSVVQVAGNRLYFADESRSAGERLKQLGYNQFREEIPLQVYKKYFKLKLPSPSDSVSLLALQRQLQDNKIRIINREKDHWIIYGDLASLGAIQKQGMVLQALDYELRPREVEITVSSRADVQKVSELGIDVFSAVTGKQREHIVIHGSAFDHQIDSARALGYVVTILKQRL